MGDGIRVMLVCAHRLVLSGLQRLINDEKPAMAVVATATTGTGAIELALEARPHVMLVDVGLAKDNDAAIISHIIDRAPTRILILAPADGNAYEAAIIQGACGVVRISDGPELLIRAICKVHAGQLWLDRSTTGRLFVELRRRPRAVDASERCFDSLTLREEEVVRALVTQPGAENRTLASNLHIAELTLRNHLSRIYDKLGVPNRMELYVFAQRHGFK